MQELVSGLVLSERFQLVRPLGQGAMAVVWLAEDHESKGRVALKILRPELAEQDHFVSLLNDEARKLSNLHHPNIVRSHGFFSSAEQTFLAMQFVAGEPLADVRELGMAELIKRLLMVVDALDYAHRAGVIHRDIKPANILCESSGQTWLTDFGIAALLDSTGQDPELRGGGSLPRISPQQLAGQPAAIADDVYSLGSTIYECIAGVPPFHPLPTPERIKIEVPAALTEDAAGRPLPEVLRNLISAMLEKSVERRPAGMAAVRSVLEDVHSEVHAEADDAVYDSELTVIRPVRREAATNVAADWEARPRTRQGDEKMSPRLVAGTLLILISLALASVFVLPSLVPSRDPAVAVPQPEPDAGESDAAQAVDPALLRAQRERADEALGDLLAADARLRAIGIDIWGGNDWQSARTAAEAGDAAYRERNYVDALAAHRRALSEMRLLEARAPIEMERAIRDGNAAIANADQLTAVAQFEIALAIDADNPAAKKGLDRALQLNRVVDITGQAEMFEREGNLQKAAELFSEAIAIDASWQPAVNGLSRVNSAFNTRDYEQSMADGYVAAEAKDFAGAKKAFIRALRVRPGDAAATTALGQIDADAQLVDIVTLRNQARQAEQNEQWVDATMLYESILKIDGSVVEAREALAVARSRASLYARLDRTIAGADQFFEDTVAAQAKALLVRARAAESPGPILSSKIQNLDRLLNIAATPVAVKFESDNLTDVVIYKVGRLGAFWQRTVDLKPGTYVAVGSRDGYRDVRLNFRVAQNGTDQPISLSCEETI